MRDRRPRSPKREESLLNPRVPQPYTDPITDDNNPDLIPPTNGKFYEHVKDQNKFNWMKNMNVFLVSMCWLRIWINLLNLYDFCCDYQKFLKLHSGCNALYHFWNLLILLILLYLKLIRNYQHLSCYLFFARIQRPKKFAG